jgi:cytochrome c556
MKLWAILLGSVVLLAGDAPLAGQGKKPNQLAKIMTEKLHHSKLLLEAIALADYKRIERAAEALSNLSRTAEWQAHNTPRYEMFSNEFRRAAEVIVEKAKRKNIDGVTLGYFELTMSCVRCHQYVRELRDASLPAPPAHVATLFAAGHRRASP